MKVLVLKLVFILALGNPESINSSCQHSADSGELNLTELKQIESLICKKAGAEFEKNHENSFTLNGHNIYTEVVIRRYGLNIYEESFCETQNPNNLFRLRLIKNINGDRELAVMIHEDEELVSYRARFDSNGFMLEDDSWKSDTEYTIEIFDLYKKYRKIYAQRVDIN